MTTRKSNLTLTNYAAKKVLGKAHTSNKKDISNEPYPSNVSVVGAGVFAEEIPSNPGDQFYTLYSASAGGPITVEKVYFTVKEDTSTQYDADQEAQGGQGDESSDFGVHGYYLQLESNYETTSSNPNTGSAPFVNSSRVYNSKGRLQIVPPFVSTENPNPYQLKLYNSGGVEISFTDNIDWTVDYYAGTIFIQDYDEIAGGIGKVPTSASAYIYVGKYVDQKITDLSASIGEGGGSAITVKDEGSNLSTAAISFDFVGEGVTATKPSGENITVTIPGGINFSRDAVVSTITASITSSILGVSGTAPISIRLPSAADYVAGQYFTVKDESGAADIKNITILASGSQTIDGVSSVVLESPFAAVNLYSNGTDKFFIY
tara:strand:- start:3094 stop:4218 length:1125 start_codon:yes stop_codon:yes gene_type:complete